MMTQRLGLLTTEATIVGLSKWIDFLKICCLRVRQKSYMQLIASSKSVLANKVKNRSIHGLAMHCHSRHILLVASKSQPT